MKFSTSSITEGKKSNFIGFFFKFSLLFVSKYFTYLILDFHQKFHEKMIAFFKRRSRSGKSEESKVSKNELVQTAELKEETISILMLNDDCLLIILMYLDIPNLCHTVDVCRRFRSISEQAFLSKYKTDSYFTPTFRREICKFGHLVTKFDVESYKYLLDGVGKFSSTRLESLRLHFISPNCDQVALIFPHLKHLEMSYCCLNRHGNWDAVFRNCPELEVLIFVHSKFDRKKPGRFDFLVQHFPKLEQFKCWALSDTVVGFLRLNPQLKKLALRRTEDEMIDAIAEYVKDIEELKLIPNSGMATKFEPKISASVLFGLSKLENLKKLSLSGFCSNEYRLGQLIKQLSKNNILLETIELYSANCNPSILKDIVSLKTLRCVLLCPMKQVNDMDLITLIAELPLLSKLVIENYDESESALTADGLIGMMNAGTNLVEVVFARFHFEVTLQNYYSLLKEVQNRDKKLKLKCIFKYTYRVLLKVPADIMYANKEYLEFIK